MNKKWQIYQANEEKVEEISEKYKINKLLATILANRNITEKEQIEKFLHHNPTYSLLPMGEIWQSMGAGQPYRGHPLYAIFTPHTYQTDGFFVAVLEKAQD